MADPNCPSPTLASPAAHLFLLLAWLLIVGPIIVISTIYYTMQSKKISCPSREAPGPTEINSPYFARLPTDLIDFLGPVTVFALAGIFHGSTHTHTHIIFYQYFLHACSNYITCYYDTSSIFFFLLIFLYLCDVTCSWNHFLLNK